VWLVMQPAPWVSGAKAKPPEDASGRRLLAVVATQSAVISAADIARSGHDGVLGVAALSAWAMALFIYLPMVLPVARGIAGRARMGLFRADDWIAMGALAISVFAAAALLRIPDEPLRSEIRVLGVAAWAAACLWIPPLVRLDIASARRRHWPPGAGRWSMVFPLGMFSTASQALGATASFPTMAQVGRVMTWVAIFAWVLVATGCAVRAATVAKDTTLRAGPTVGA
jgi:tellurite resistance protein TehA-like permease